jgi:hypothetical protein
VWISRKHNKKIRLIKVTYNSHRVLKELLHKAIAAYKARWENKPVAKVTYIYILVDKSVYKPSIEVCTNVLLV